jgi:uncharacterized membrane protein
LISDNIITEEGRTLIEEAIRVAESNTSGEIRVHLEDDCKGAVLDRAAFVFSELEMHKTSLRNGVLIYAALRDRKLAIIGDSGFNQYVTPGFWTDGYQLMTAYLKKEQVVDGLLAGVAYVGDKIKELFPISSTDKNELPNTVSTKHNLREKKK